MRDDDLMSRSNRVADEAYVTWKGWGDGFGVLARGDAAYFQSELREVIRQGGIRHVLEVGYGNGAFLAYCVSKGWSVTGTELLPELVSLARAAGFDAHPAEALAELPDAAFDLIVAFDVFEHIPPESSVEFLRTLAAKLSPAGNIVLRFPNADTWVGNPLQYGDVTHVNAIGALKMEYYAGVAGLEIRRLRAIRRRGFSTSLLHGIHKYSASLIARALAAVVKALYLPDLPVVLSTPSVLCVLRHTAQHRAVTGPTE